MVLHAMVVRCFDFAKAMIMRNESSGERRNKNSTLYLRREVYKGLMMKVASEAENKKRR
jgi:hypothetical protein